MKRIRHICKKTADRTYMLMSNFYLQGRYYSWKFAFYCFMDWIGFYIRKPDLSHKYIQRKQEWIDKYIEKNYSDIVEKYRNMEESTIMANPYRVWMFWGQGEKEMPPLVKACYRQLCANSPVGGGRIA